MSEIVTFSQLATATMPEKFKAYCPTVRVTIDFTDIRCESSLTLHSEVCTCAKETV